jgi:hypothetical protein
MQRSATLSADRQSLKNRIEELATTLQHVRL